MVVFFVKSTDNLTREAAMFNQSAAAMHGWEVIIIKAKIKLEVGTLTLYFLEIKYVGTVKCLLGDVM